MVWNMTVVVLCIVEAMCHWGNDMSCRRGYEPDSVSVSVSCPDGEIFPAFSFPNLGEGEMGDFLPVCVCPSPHWSSEHLPTVLWQKLLGGGWKQCCDDDSDSLFPTYCPSLKLLTLYTFQPLLFPLFVWKVIFLSWKAMGVEAGEVSNLQL